MEAPSFQSTVLYDKIYTRRYNMLGGVPIGTIVGDFEFSNAARDVKTLSIMSEICAVSHAPFLTSPSPKLFGIPEGKGWEVLEDLDDTAIENRFLNVSVVEMTEWRAFREKPDSRYVSMCMPKALARLPYGMGDCEDPNGGQGAFEFQELPIGKDGVPVETGVDRYCWKNAAFCMAQCMSDAFAYHGWAVAIRGLESGGKVEGLPIHYFASEENPDVRVQCPTQVPLAMSKDAILGKVGFLPLLYELNSAHAVFIGGQTVHKPKAFDDLYVNMVKAGEAGGALEVILQRLAEFKEKSQSLQRKVKGAMIYPVAVILVATAIVGFIMVYIIPKFKKIFEDFGIELPSITTALIDTSDFILNYWYVILLSPVVLWLTIKIIKKNKTGAYIVDKVFLKMPLLGKILEKATVARTSRTLGTLIASGVPILEGLIIARDTAGNHVFARAFDKIYGAIREGESMSIPLKEARIVDDMVVNMVDVGEETGALDNMLYKVADVYDEEVEVLVEGLISLLEPLMVVVLGLIVGFIVIALFMPLIKLLNDLS